MSRIISYSTADKADIVSFLGPGRSLTLDQKRILGLIREKAEQSQRELDRQGLDWGLSVPAALDHLLAGHATSDAEYAEGAYFQALQHIIDCNSSDPVELGVFSKPATFFRLVDDELRRLGVSADLLLSGRLFSGPPQEIQFRLPYPTDGPHIGMLPLAEAKPAANAYREVLERMDESFRYEIQELIDKLDVQHEEWQRATKNVAGYTHDTIFFSITG
ncbi:DUF7691 family protein [Streptomyces griseorubiginosus]|uniref:DUF7691 family protein n=1 Tax=Streptomyces griseorubiginosus TaxID=67304 RepID=UPI0036EAFEB4